MVRRHRWQQGANGKCGDADTSCNEGHESQEDDEGDESYKVDEVVYYWDEISDVDEHCAHEDDEVQKHEGCECFAEDCYENEESLAYESEDGLTYENDQLDESYESDETCANGCDEDYGDDEVYEHEECECGAEELRL